MNKFVPVSLALVGALGLGSIATGASAQDYYGYGSRYSTPCAAQAHRNGTTGALLGALAGAALGSNLASHHGGRSGGTAIGAVAGALIGNQIGRSSSADRCDYGYNQGYYAPAYTGGYAYGARYNDGRYAYRGYEHRRDRDRDGRWDNRGWR
ncbi:MAG: glycine zipper 2TM domain-containing protein [Proteobacteria bacterium]|nr:glycine zipper 2TM domain-containing protein [Pseudomonadota bacterium]